MRSIRFCIILFMAPVGVTTLAPQQNAYGGETTRVSVDSSGTQGNGQSAFPAISANGRFVAFSSVATNLVAGDSNESSDVFVHDRQTGVTTRVSVNSSGNQGNDYSGFFGGNRDTSLSADGRFVAFVSRANNLVPGDTNGAKDVFVHDRVCRTTTRVNVDSFGNQGNGTSAGPPSNTSLSADGRFVAFDSDDPTLVAGDTNGRLDVFVHENKVSSVAVFQLCQIDNLLTEVLTDVAQAGLNPGLTDQLVTRLTKVQRFNAATSAACVVGHQTQATEKFKTAKSEVDKFVKTLKKEQASVGLVPEEDPLDDLILQGNGLSNQMQGVLNTGVCS